MCQVLTVPVPAGDAAVRKNIGVPVLRGTRAVCVNYHCVN